MVRGCQVLAGRYMIVYGGWSGQALRDVVLLDLAVCAGSARLEHSRVATPRSTLS
jgi:hypothetical protein